MKKLVLITALSSLFVSSGCLANPIEILKNQIFLNINSTATIGSALDTYAESFCMPGSETWQTFKDENQREAVSFSCVDNVFPTRMEDWKKSFIQQEMHGPTKLLGSNANEMSSIEEALIWYGKKVLKEDKYEYLLKNGYGFDFIDRVISDLFAFDIKKVTFYVRFKSNQDDPSKYDISFVGHEFQYGEGVEDVVVWPTSVLKYTAYAKTDFSSFLEDNRSDRLKLIVESYNEAKRKAQSNVAQSSATLSNPTQSSSTQNNVAQSHADPIDVVKNSIYPAYSAWTIGAALDEYGKSYCSPGSQRWDSYQYETRFGKKHIVNFTCKDFDFLNKARLWKKDWLQSAMSRAAGIFWYKGQFSEWEDVQKWLKRFDKSQLDLLARNGYDAAYLERVHDECSAFELVDSNLFIQFEQNLDDKSKYDIRDTGYEVKFLNGSTAKIEVSRDQLLESVFGGESFADYQKRYSSHPKWLVDAYHEAKKHTPSNVAQNKENQSVSAQSDADQSTAASSNLGPIEVVKNTIYTKLNNSMTIGAALDAYDSCAYPKWEAFQSEKQGVKRQIVKFSCEDLFYPIDVGLTWGPAYLQKKMAAPTQLLGHIGEEFTDTPDVTKWLRKLDSTQRMTLTRHGYNDDYFRRLLDEFHAFYFDAKLVIQFEQNLDDKSKYDIGFVAHEVKYFKRDFGALIGVGAEILKHTVYANRRFEERERTYSNRLEWFVDTYNEAKLRHSQ